MQREPGSFSDEEHFDGIRRRDSGASSPDDLSSHAKDRSEELRCDVAPVNGEETFHRRRKR